MPSRLRDAPLLIQVGPGHPHVRQCSLARRNLTPRREQLTVVEGLWAHERLIEAGAAVEAFFWCPGDDNQLGFGQLTSCVNAVAARARSAYQITPKTLARINRGATSPGMVSLVRLPRWRAARLITPSARLALVADGIEYAGNLGTLLRTVDACGADVLVLTNPVARVTHPKVFVASRGTVLTTPVVEYPSVREARRALQDAGFTVFVADPAAPRSYLDVAYPQPTAFVVGSEGDGVSTEWHDG
ncbi:MAG: TrmH family RNA methyltransferase, partial [Nocardioidaceae bacterium]